MSTIDRVKTYTHKWFMPRSVEDLQNMVALVLCATFSEGIQPVEILIR